MMNDTSSNVSTEIDRVLKEAGLDSSPMDPASMQALKEMYAVDNKRTSGEEEENDSLPPLSRVDRSALQRNVSDITTPLVQPYVSDHDTSASTARSTTVVDPSASRTERQILDQLQQQTNLILQLHHRIDALQDSVERLSTGANVVNTDSRAQPRRATDHRHLPDTTMNDLPVVDPPDHADIELHPPDNHRHPPRQRLHIPLLTPLLNVVTNIPTDVANSRLAHMLRVYAAVRRQQAPAFDVFLIFKVLVMACILMARVSRRQRDTDSLLVVYRTYLLGILIVGGFLVKTGYLEFLHNFLVRDNYLARIWHGEIVDINNLPPARVPGPRDAAAAGGAAAAGPLNFLRRTLLGGRVPRNDPARRHGIGKAVQDIVCLLGSFFLSIFPMWIPEAPQPVVAEPAPEQQQPPAEQLAEPPPQQELPGVQPPADAYQAEEEGDDDDADEQ